MKKNVGEMNERELLAELVLQGRRAEKTERIKTGVLAALLLAVIILALIYIPRIAAPIRELSDGMEEIKTTFKEAERILSSFDDGTVDRFKQTMESVNETSQQLRVLMDKLRDSGLDKLQSTIEGLNKTIDSLLHPFG
ncbi:MAG: hypothetical protein IJH48_04960 [Oscillospiraceae bacterium]|nr:hypothetical protein [Oscillospiraceae bacterium]